ncbi:two-component regulator propeller domain-containing protein [Maridesulfovibrio sp.]|uniref:two-component regulator propeller domain-containing protein n=1 Tax=Maridesulfovibrio sp. TaxID=2795000 RepID=UPI002A18CF82|nr:two-component regulator propeller domain-containing protein [Maridesulfovibrio sp.]
MQGRIRLTRFISALVLAFIVTAAQNAQAFQQDLRFRRFSLNDGLSQSSVLCMLQDSKGFMWFGTYDGLNRYDGLNIKIYSNTKSPGSLTDSNICALYEDSAGMLWVGTKSGGLNYYNRKNDTFEHFLPEPDNPESISGKNVSCIYEDSKGRLWVGTYNGLNRYDRASGKFKRFQHTDNPGSISGNEVKCVFEDLQGTIWVGTASGLNMLHELEGTFDRYQPDRTGKNSICDNAVLCFYQKNPGSLWIGTKNGISIFNTHTGKFTNFFRSLEINDIYEDNAGNLWLGTLEGLGKRYPETAELKPEEMRFAFFKNNQLDPQSLGDNKVTSILEDQSGVLWVGTYADGLSILTPKMQSFGLINRQPWKENTIPGRQVSAVLEDRQGLVWIGTYKKGISVYNPSDGTFTNYSSRSPAPWDLSGDRINCIFQDSSGLIWVGTRKKGVFVIDKQKGVVARYRRSLKDKNSLSQDNVWWIYEGSMGYIWVGTSKQGLNRLDRKTGLFRRYKPIPGNPRSLGHKRVRNIFEDSRHNLWICTNAGLDLMDRKSGTFKHYSHDQNNPESISNNRVTPIAEAADGSLWVGTDKGLNRFDPVSGIFTRITEKNGLANDGIQGLCIDSEGKIWVSTFKGISALDPATGKICNFSLSDGLQGIEFWINSYNRGQSGRIYFGGLKGMNMFNPRDIRTNPTPPPVVITGLNIMNTPAYLGTNISETKEITLSWKDPMFTFFFAALDYQNPRLNKYRYKLEGFHNSWIDASSAGTATFTNFDHGDYVFHVIASNSDGVWNETGTSLKIHIIPPFWKTWWFATLALLGLILLLMLAVHIRIRSIRKKGEELSRLVEEKTADLNEEISNHMKTEEQLEQAIIQAKEANEAKSSFLASMSHEIRTPLNSIIGIADLLKHTDMSEEQAEYVSIFESSGEILLAIINDILDFSKIEANHVTLEHISMDLLQEVESIVGLQNTAATTRGIDLVCRFKPDVPEFVIGDPTRLRQILLNIFSNAVKFTSCGQVSITVERNFAHGPDDITFVISDTGVGIVQDKMEAIFAPFSQGDSSTTRKFGGSGLGLSISKKLAELMGGSITASSTPGEGSTFSVTLPLPRAGMTSPQVVRDLNGAEVVVAAVNKDITASLCETVNSFNGNATPCTNTESLRALLAQTGDRKCDLLICDLAFDGRSVLDTLKMLSSTGVTLPPVLMLQKGASFDRSNLEKGIYGMGLTLPPPRRLLLSTAAKLLEIDSGKESGRAGTELPKLPELKILLAEDNLSNRELIRHFLKHCPTTLIMASNGEEALKLAQNEKFDIILLDMEMPLMDGYEFMRRFRSPGHGPQAGIIALTAHASADFRQKCIDAGADEFLSKPIKQKILLQAILDLHNRLSNA